MALRLGKTKILLVALLLVLAIGGTTGYLIFIKDDKPTPSELVGENDPFLKEVATYESISSLYNQEKFTEVIPQAKAYAADSKHDPTLRLVVLDMCIRSAQKANDQASEEECYSLAKAQVVELPRQDDKSHWQQQIEAAYKGESETTNVEDSGGPQ